MDEVRRQLTQFLTTAQAHMTFADAVKDFPLEKINAYPTNVDYTPWDLLEHIRITQSDLLEFINAKKYTELSWPEEYWPKKDKKASAEDWKMTIQMYKKDLKEIVAIAKDTSLDLASKVPNGDTQTYIRELLLAIDHTSYHIGEFAVLRQVMGTWPKDHKE